MAIANAEAAARLALRFGENGAMYRVLVATTLALALTTPTSGRASDPLIAENAIPGKLGGTLALTSEYLFRGLSQTDDVPAIQGSVDYTWNLFYASIWGSNVKFNDATVELDYSLGLTGTGEALALDKLSWSFGAIYYNYPGSASALNYDFWEAAGTLGYDFGIATLKGSLNYSPDFFGGSGDALYYALDATVPLPRSIAISLHVGHQTVRDNALFLLPDYTDWSVGVSAQILGFTWSLRYVDTDIDASTCSDACDARGLLTVTRTF